MKDIDFDEYQKECYDLISEDGRKDMVLNGVLGLAGESGECCDLVKKNRFQGHELSKDKLIEEVGDVLWYVAETCSGLGISLKECAKINLDKLHKRFHGDKFNKEDSINRNEK